MIDTTNIIRLYRFNNKSQTIGELERHQQTIQTDDRPIEIFNWPNTSDQLAYFLIPLLIYIQLILWILGKNEINHQLGNTKLNMQINHI